jgi:hypothetical protein
MRRTVLAAVLLLAPPGFVAAQGAEPAPRPQDPQAAYDELVKALNQAISDWQTEVEAAVKKAQEAGERIPAIAMQPPTKEFIGRAQELAAAYEGKDDAVRFLAFVIKNASTERNAVKKAVETLAANHATSKAIADVVPFLPNGMRLGAAKAVMSLLDGIVDNHADVDCKAQALITRGSIRLETARTDEQRQAAEKDLRDVAGLTKNPDLLAQAKDALFEIENLQVGCTAPEIAGVDVEGQAFKLSDYRGKVVLLDFWGFW